MDYDKIVNGYFDWLCNLVVEDRFADDISFRKLLMHLHSRPFVYIIIPNDQNRAQDGLSLRFRYGLEVGKRNFDKAEEVESMIKSPCSILEMMAALALRCEEDITDNAVIGNRTGHWFWRMIANLHLNGMEDQRYDRDYVDQILDRFLHRDYSPDGDGGLFKIPGIKDDLREVEIWTQMLWYLDTIL